MMKVIQIQSLHGMGSVMIVKSKISFSNKIKNINEIIIYIITNEVLFWTILLPLIKLSFAYAKFRNIRQKGIVPFVEARSMINADVTKSLMQKSNSKSVNQDHNNESLSDIESA